jgi:hypothetical protein
MAVMPRESWTDERLDDFRGEVNRRFDVVDKRLDETNQRMEEGFARINDRLDGLHRLLFQALVALIVGLLGAVAAVIAQL